MIVVAGKPRLMPPKLVPRVHLSNSQSDCSPVTDAMKSDLPGAHRDVLKVIRLQISPGVQSPGGIVCCQLEASNSSVRAII